MLVGVKIENELDCPCVVVAHCLGCVDCWTANGLPDHVWDVWWSLFDYFLMSTLDWAVSLEQVNIIFVFVTENLHLDMPWSRNVLLYDNSIIFKSFQWLSLAWFECFIKLLFFMDNSHAFASTSGHGFDQNGKTHFLSLLTQIFWILVVLMIAGYHWHIGCNHDLLRLALAAHAHDSRWRRSNKLHTIF